VLYGDTELSEKSFPTSSGVPLNAPVLKKRNTGTTKMPIVSSIRSGSPFDYSLSMASATYTPPFTDKLTRSASPEPSCQR